MKTYEVSDFGALVRGNSYVGRGILTGMTPEGNAFNAYFIMGRSENSRNRVFVKKDGALFTEPYDPSRVSDPSLIIYAAVREYQNHLIVTNGDQTDTIYEGLAKGKCMRGALKSRKFEPDAPNFTPRISSVTDFADGGFLYSMSILKSGDEAGEVCNRFTFDYEPLPGVGHFLHTYEGDGNPLPTFRGEPERVAIPSDTDAFAEEIWNALDENNKISLYVRVTDPKTGAYRERIINKYTRKNKE